MRPHPIVGPRRCSETEAAFGKHGEGLSRTCIFDLQSAQVKMSMSHCYEPTFFFRDSAFKNGLKQATF